MTRLTAHARRWQKIDALRAQRRSIVRKHQAVAVLDARLQGLVTMQIRSENRRDHISQKVTVS